jgi:hypothetical protein
MKGALAVQILLTNSNQATQEPLRDETINWSATAGERLILAVKHRKKGDGLLKFLNVARYLRLHSKQRSHQSEAEKHSRLLENANQPPLSRALVRDAHDEADAGFCDN